MKVTLISYTPSAVELLLFTKSTRLNLSPDLFGEMFNKSSAVKIEELQYMANTIPSSWEFIDYVFLVEGVSRAYTHQQVRTRAASYAQQSMRVNDMADFEYVLTDGNHQSMEAMDVIAGVVEGIKQAYSDLRSLGQAPEDARGILPTNIATNIICKFNLRTFSELVKSRTGGRTQSEYQAVVNAMADEVLKVHQWASMFLFKRDRDYFDELETFAKAKFPDLKERGELLKIIDHMRKEG